MTWRPLSSWPRWTRLLGESGSSTLPTKNTSAGTAARPRDSRHPTSGARKLVPVHRLWRYACVCIRQVWVTGALVTA